MSDIIFKNAMKKVNNPLIIFNKKQNYVEGAELFEKAGNIYKMSKDYDNSIEAYLQAIKYYNLGNENFNTLSIYKSLIALYLRSRRYEDVIEMHKKIIELYADRGESSYIAKNYVAIAENYERMGDDEGALNSYELSIEQFEISSSDFAEYYKYMDKIANFYSKNLEFYKAIKIYDEIINKIMDTNQMRFQVKAYILKAVLCKIAISEIGDANKDILDHYTNIEISFSGLSQEYKLCNGIAEAIEKNSEELFTNTLRDFDNLKRFDHWMVKILKIIKEKYFEKESLM